MSIVEFAETLFHQPKIAQILPDLEPCFMKYSMIES